MQELTFRFYKILGNYLVASHLLAFPLELSYIQLFYYLYIDIYIYIYITFHRGWLCIKNLIGYGCMHKLEEDEVGGACGTNGREEKCV
jgi:hypothetical protein